MGRGSHEALKEKYQGGADSRGKGLLTPLDHPASVQKSGITNIIIIMRQCCATLITAAVAVS